MTNNIDHERCSEQLRAYIRRELDEREARAVEEHLASCDACRSELAGLKALLARDGAGLDLRERRKLHEAVERAIGPSQPLIFDTGFDKKRSWAQRFAPTLSAAALLLLVFIVAVSGGLTGSGDGDDAGMGAADGGGAGSRESDDLGTKGTLEESFEPDAGPEETAAKPNRKPRKAWLQSDDGTDTALRTPPRPSFDVYVGDFESAAKPGVLREFASSYTVADAEKREWRYISLLSEKAPSEVRGQVQNCGGVVRAASEEPVLAASGALGRIDRRPGLFLSFVYTNAERGPLSSYMVWAWPRGSCSTRLAYRAGSIDD